MPDISTGGSPPAGPGGIPTKYLIIGGGAALVGLFLFMNKGGGAAAPDPANATYGPALGPNAALAVGDLQNRFLSESGVLQQQSMGYFDELHTLLDSQAQALSDQATVTQGGINRFESFLPRFEAFYSRQEEINKRAEQIDAERRAEYEDIMRRIGTGQGTV